MELLIEESGGYQLQNDQCSRLFFNAKKKLDHHRDSIKTRSACDLLICWVVPSLLLFALFYSITTEKCQYEECQSFIKMQKIVFFLFYFVLFCFFGILAISDIPCLKLHFKLYLKSDFIFFL